MEPVTHFHLFDRGSPVLCNKPFIKQGIPTLNIVLSFTSFSGVILIIHPEFLFGTGTSQQKTENYYAYVAMMVSAAFLNALNSHFIHGLAKKIDPIVSMLYSNLGSLVLSTAILFSV